MNRSRGSCASPPCLCPVSAHSPRRFLPTSRPGRLRRSGRRRGPPRRARLSLSPRRPFRSSRFHPAASPTRAAILQRSLRPSLHRLKHPARLHDRRPCGIPASAQACLLQLHGDGYRGPRLPARLSAGNAATARVHAQLPCFADGRERRGRLLGATGVVTTVAGVSGFDLVIDVNGYYAATGIIDSVNGLTGNVQIVPGTDLGVGVAGQTITVSVQSMSSAMPDTLVRRDGSGGFAAGTITANLSGNATSATTAITANTATSFLGPLGGDVTGPQGATTLSSLRGFPVGSRAAPRSGAGPDRFAARAGRPRRRSPARLGSGLEHHGSSSRSFPPVGAAGNVRRILGPLQPPRVHDHGHRALSGRLLRAEGRRRRLRRPAERHLDPRLPLLERVGCHARTFPRRPWSREISSSSATRLRPSQSSTGAC